MKRGSSFGEWFLLLCLLGLIVMLLFHIGNMENKPNNFQSWSWTTIDTYILRPIKEI